MNKLLSPSHRRPYPRFKLIPRKLVLFANLTILLVMCPIVKATPESDGVMSAMFSGTGLLAMIGLMCFALLVARFVRSRSSAGRERATDVHSEQTNTARNRSVSSNGSGNEKRALAGKPPVTVFGAYRIKHEVAKLVLGHPHREEILASRATEDMRAIETALLNFVTSPESTDDERRRSREALEKYGFIARYSAALLRATDPFERASAARSLGQMGSLAALPFLLDSLYDSETIVRNQAIASVGELKDPAALDALRDVARVCPDLPANLINRALNGNSTDGANTVNLQNALEITQLKPASKVEDLPQSTDDKRWLGAMTKLASVEAEERIEAVKILGEYPVQKSVMSLTNIVRDEAEPSVRAVAVGSLANINHESVFPAMLLAMADESREVRASAARSMSRLSFDRSGAYVRLTESNDQAALREFATACVNAGIVSQNIERLAASDRRQAYEAFSLISLMAKAQTTEALIEAIANHSNINVRLSVIHLLATTGEPHILKDLQQLAAQENVPEEVKTALLEGMYKLEQSRANSVATSEIIEQSV